MRKDDERILNELIPDNQLLAMDKNAESTEKVRFIITPGHGYLEVDDTPENRKFFTAYDYERNGKLYLEEDEDGPKWLDAHGIANFRDVPTVHSEDDPKLRFLEG
jgi:hypothetical protein